MNLNGLPARALYCHVTGERSQGSGAKKSLDNVKEDLQLWNINFKRAVTAVISCRDRTAWMQPSSTPSSSRVMEEKRRRKLGKNHPFGVVCTAWSSHIFCRPRPSDKQKYRIENKINDRHSLDLLVITRSYRNYSSVITRIIISMQPIAAKCWG